MKIEQAREIELHGRFWGSRTFGADAGDLYVINAKEGSLQGVEGSASEEAVGGQTLQGGKFFLGIQRLAFGIDSDIVILLQPLPGGLQAA